jgi:hypothetical protein
MAQLSVKLEQNDWQLLLFAAQISGNAMQSLVGKITEQLQPQMNPPPARADGEDKTAVN